MPWDEMYKNGSSGKTDSQGSPILLKIVSENLFSGKTNFYAIASSSDAAPLVVVSPRVVVVVIGGVVFGLPSLFQPPQQIGQEGENLRQREAQGRL